MFSHCRYSVRITCFVTVLLLTVNLPLNFPKSCKSYNEVRLCYGSFGCFAGPKNATVSLDFGQRYDIGSSGCVQFIVRCSFHCQKLPLCRSFNVREDRNVCEIFFYYPYLVQYATKCRAFEIPKTLDYNVSTNTNVAFEKRSCQSSSQKLFNGIFLGSWLLVDGVLTNSASGDRCSHTSELSSGMNWWMIDLELTLRVQRVNLFVDTNSSFDQSRLRNLIVGMTNLSWFYFKPNISNYPICAVNLLPTPYSPVIGLNCSPSTPPGRFLIVQQAVLPQNTSGAFSLCEVQVYPY